MADLGSLKKLLLGAPLATDQQAHERLSKKFALPVFSADAISSTAYATEEILLALVAAGTAAFTWSLPVAVAVAFLLAIVAISYRQTVHAYPNGGGSYQVSRSNLGLAPGLVAAASLMVGYVATVCVSAASGVAAIASAFPVLNPYRLPLCIALVILVAVANLRGVRESGRIFAAPTYFFVLMCGGLILVGLIRWMSGDLGAAQEMQREAQQDLTIILVLRAFAGGCAAMTGTEAIANAVPDFRPPESKNASVTLGIMAAVLGFLLLGVTGLSNVVGAVPLPDETVLSQIGRSVYGNDTAFYFALQIATMAILVLGANTSYAGFPRLSSVLARDGLMPRQFANRGDRLVFSNGIIGLTLAAVAIIAIFNADTHRMVPFYALGVFIGFTLSQAGMVVHWRRLATPGWEAKAVMNGFGAALTAVVSVVLLVTKFVEGAYIVVITVPVLVGAFYMVKSHYNEVSRALEPQTNRAVDDLANEARARKRTTVVLFVAQVNAMTARALSIARSLSPGNLRAVTISNDPERFERLRKTWHEMGLDEEVPLDVVESPYREFIPLAVKYVQSLQPSPDHAVTVLIPEFVVERWWQAILHNQDAFRLKRALMRVPWVSTMSIPLHIAEVVRQAEPTRRR